MRRVLVRLRALPLRLRRPSACSFAVSQPGPRCAGFIDELRFRWQQVALQFAVAARERHRPPNCATLDAARDRQRSAAPAKEEEDRGLRSRRKLRPEEDEVFRRPSSGRSFNSIIIMQRPARGGGRATSIFPCRRTDHLSVPAARCRRCAARSSTRIFRIKPGERRSPDAVSRLLAKSPQHSLEHRLTARRPSVPTRARKSGRQTEQSAVSVLPTVEGEGRDILPPPLQISRGLRRLTEIGFLVPRWQMPSSSRSSSRPRPGRCSSPGLTGSGKSTTLLRSTRPTWPGGPRST